MRPPFRRGTVTLAFTPAPPAPGPLPAACAAMSLARSVRDTYQSKEAMHVVGQGMA
jgi:hypothetical protein